MASATDEGGGGHEGLTPPFIQMTISLGDSSDEIGKNQKNSEEPSLAGPMGSEPAKDSPTSKSTFGMPVPLTRNSVDSNQISWLERGAKCPESRLNSRVVFEFRNGEDPVCRLAKCGSSLDLALEASFLYLRSGLNDSKAVAAKTAAGSATLARQDAIFMLRMLDA